MKLISKLFLLFLIIISFAIFLIKIIKKNRYPTEIESSCRFKKSKKTLTNTYPFSKSNKIELLAYSSREDALSNYNLIKDGKFMVGKIQQSTILDKSQTDSLFSILVNWPPKEKDYFNTQADCYDPHHCIVFYQDEIAIAFIEICFECNGIKESQGINFEEFCDEKWMLIKKFLIQNKINYAT